MDCVCGKRFRTPPLWGKESKLIDCLFHNCGLWQECSCASSEERLKRGTVLQVMYLSRVWVFLLHPVSSTLLSPQFDIPWWPGKGAEARRAASVIYSCYGWLTNTFTFQWRGGMETIYSAVGPTNSLTSIAYATLSRAHAHLINTSTYFKRATEAMYV